MISDETYNMYFEWVKDYIDKKCIIRDTPMDGIDGEKWSWVFVMGNGLYNTEFLFAVSQMFLYQVNKHIGHTNFSIAGLQTGSTPLLSGIPFVAKYNHNLNINSISVRKNKKTSGLKQITDGIIDENKPILMLDTICTTTRSFRTVYNILKDLNLRVLNTVFTIVNRTPKNKIISHLNLKDEEILPNNFKIISLFDMKEFNLKGV
jgi:orotate phosphoribosyltransferase